MVQGHTYALKYKYKYSLSHRYITKELTKSFFCMELQPLQWSPAEGWNRQLQAVTPVPVLRQRFIPCPVVCCSLLELPSTKEDYGRRQRHPSTQKRISYLGPSSLETLGFNESTVTGSRGHRSQFTNLHRHSSHVPHTPILHEKVLLALLKNR